MHTFDNFIQGTKTTAKTTIKEIHIHLFFESLYCVCGCLRAHMQCASSYMENSLSVLPGLDGKKDE